MQNDNPTYEDLLNENKRLRKVLSEQKISDGYLFLDNLLNNINDPVFVKDSESRLVLTNDAFCEIFGLPREQIIGKTLAENVSVEEREHFLKVDNEVLKSGNVSLIEEPLTVNNQETKTILTRKSRYTNDKGEHFLIGVIHDITEIKKVSEDLLKAKEKAEESDRLKSAFLANMSHEIRTPMNAILGFSKLLKREDITINNRAKYIDFIDSEGNRLLNIISDIVDISMLESKQLSLNYTPCDLNKLFDQLKNQFDIHPEKADCVISVKKGLNYPECLISMDATRLTQVLTNLIENALKFTQKGNVEYGYSKENDHLLFYVKDNGIGIRLEDQKTIFDRFTQAENRLSNTGKGNGLGLSIAKNLVELLKGNIWVESELGIGATFFFKIPYSIAERSTAKKVLVKKANENISGATILIAEDEFLNYKYLKTLLEGLQFKTIHAKNGQIAVNTLQNDPSISFILMDINMPLKNGYDATKEIRKFNTKVPIVALTAYAMEEDKKKVINSGFSDYLTKPIVENKLIEMIHKHL